LNDSQRRNALLVYQESEAHFVLFTSLLPPSPLLLMKMEDLHMLEAEVFYLLTDHCSFCVMQLVVL